MESFWAAQESNRLEIFWDFFKPIDSEWRSPAEQRILDDYYESQKYLEKDWRSYLEFLQRSRSPVPPKSMEVFERQLERRRGTPRFRKLPKSDLIYFDKLVHELRWSLQREIELRPRAVQAKSKPTIDYDLLREILSESAPRVARMFKSISQSDWIDDVTLAPYGISGLSTKLTLSNGKTVDPTDILSEANLDLLALLIHIEMQIAASTRGQARVLILDDVFQSVDAPLRQRAMRVLIHELSDWQLVITLHDRLWMEILARICTDAMGVSPSLIELRKSPDGEGPTVYKSSSGLLRDLYFVRDHIGSPVLLVGACGRALEAMVDYLSISLRCKVVRAENDKYSIGDLLPSVIEVLSHNVDLGVRDSAKRLKYAQFSRNTFGAHHHAEGDLISPEEALDVANAVIKIAEVSTCTKCGLTMGRADIDGDTGKSGQKAWRFWCRKHRIGQPLP
ncbi:hypothetical protein [Brachybacterium paraconglomeratum]|uniref:hypothetical protein n=1 Tax=Brachybacterium paraconglomeratum TaxID=173362 RepID=UPI0022AF70ED|nr:hypothetical protein [Brachybacterium paraconglomeratum]MCZ4327503.1 hypothetical protein [Brachybacterium paraconglomeratum]